MENEERYPLIIRLLHWVMAMTILTMLCNGLYMANIPDDAADKYDLYPTHKAFGMFVMAMIFIRIPARLMASIPSSHLGLKSWEITLSHIVHGL
ncbi:MAG: cytochrome b/b6 domain-containing protein [Pseudomonadales bacterium]|nr:cytochrome b/b6 domain-containing protein [Pseudomonadales bacterium]